MFISKLNAKYFFKLLYFFLLMIEVTHEIIHANEILIFFVKKIGFSKVEINFTKVS